MKKESDAGFAISTYNQSLIEENAKERFSPRYGDRRDRARALRAGFIDPKAEITQKGWHQINNDVQQLEGNALSLG